MKTKRIFQNEIIKDLSALNIMSSFPDRSYYTAESQAIIMCKIGLPPSSLEEYMLRAKLKDGKVIGKNMNISISPRLTVDLIHVPVGNNIIDIELFKKTGEMIFQETLTINKKESNPGNEWKTDRINRVVLHDGKPFFPVGIFMYGVKSDNEKAFQEVSEAGFNTVGHWSSRLQPDEINSYHRVAAKYDLYVIGKPTNVTGIGAAIDFKKFSNLLDDKALAELTRMAPLYTLNRFKNALFINTTLKSLSINRKQDLFGHFFSAYLDRMRQIIEFEKGHRNLIAYNSFDEPFIDNLKMYIQGRILYKTIHEIDGYHPVALLYERSLLSSPLRDKNEATDWCDILLTDAYWTPVGNRTTDTPNLVAGQTHMFDKIAANKHKPLWITIAAERTSHFHKRSLKMKEQLCQTYMALIQGAKGLVYFRYPTRQVSWDFLKLTAKQLKVLGPIVVNESIPQTIEYSPLKLKFENGILPNVQVQAALFKNPDGGYILLAGNAAYYPVDFSCRIAGLSKTTITRLFSDVSYQAKNGTFQDEFEPLGVRAYVIAEKALELTEGPVQIKVDLVEHKELVEKEISFPRTGRKGRKNIAINSSFEEMTVKGIPDYYAGVEADAENPFHGSVCVKIGDILMSYLSPQHIEPTQYVLSAYLKSARDGAKVGFYGHGARETFKLTKDWQRYHAKMTVPPGAHFKESIRIIPHGKNTKVWADAIQFEQGDTPTDFEY